MTSLPLWVEQSRSVFELSSQPPNIFRNLHEYNRKKDRPRALLSVRGAATHEVCSPCSPNAINHFFYRGSAKVKLTGHQNTYLSSCLFRCLWHHYAQNTTAPEFQNAACRIECLPAERTCVRCMSWLQRCLLRILVIQSTALERETCFSCLNSLRR